MLALGVIPSRFGSTRFPGKALAQLGGKCLIQWVYENAKKASLLERVVIATDDRRIYTQARSFNAEVCMTSKRHKSGTERVAEVAAKLKANIVVNIQGDEPFLKTGMINKLVKSLERDKHIQAATLAAEIKNSSDADDPNVVKVVVDKNNFALYFSRSKIPYLRNQKPVTRNQWYKHLGIYAYKRSALLDFVKFPRSSLEKIECLEQLRILENGFRIKVIKTKQDSIGVDTPEDLAKAKRYLRYGHYD